MNPDGHPSTAGMGSMRKREKYFSSPEQMTSVGGRCHEEVRERQVQGEEKVTTNIFKCDHPHFATKEFPGVALGCALASYEYCHFQFKQQPVSLCLPPRLFQTHHLPVK